MVYWVYLRPASMNFINSKLLAGLQYSYDSHNNCFKSCDNTTSCKDKHGNLVTDPQVVLRLWRKHFSTLLQGDDNTNAAFRDVPNPIDDDGMKIPPPSREEVQVAIMHLKNNKAAGPDGLPAELFKTVCNELVGGACNSLFTKYG